MKVRMVASLMAGLACMLVVAQAAQAKADNLIVPGQRIGHIRIGMLLDEFVSTAGQPNTRRTDESVPGRRILRYYYSGWSADLLDVAAPWVCAIYVSSPQWNTESGLRVGDSVFDMTRKQGSNYRSVEGLNGLHFVTYDTGLRVNLRNRRIIEMTVVYPGRSCID